MKKTEKSEIHKNSILKWLAFSSVVTVTAAVFITGIYLRLQVNDESDHLPDQMPQYKVETKAVMNERKDTREFLNRPSLSPEPGDNRQVFRIIEVIPHDACSIFPYLIDWGSISEYDKNVPIGYEGILLSAEYAGATFQMFSEADVKAKDSRPFTFKKGDIVRDYLTNFDIELTASSNSRGKWYRQTDTKSSLLNELQGYFEYVGPGKGLYYINASQIAAKAEDKGIHYEIQAVPRKGTENPKGEMYVKGAAYYWPAENTSTAKPFFNGMEVKTQTGNNYDLSFVQNDTGMYIADTDGVLNDPSGGKGYDYILQVDPVLWDFGFRYEQGAGYHIKSILQNPDGDYVRFENEKQDDAFVDMNMPDIKKGYFVYDKDHTYTGVDRYDVVFKEAEGKKGCYSPLPADVWPEKGYSFAFAGEGKGTYQIPFLYASSSELASKTLYDAKVIRVTQNQGGYALTATSDDGKRKPVYSKGVVSGQDNDYAEVITNINFTDAVNDAKRDEARIPGVSIGGYDATVPEWGGWIFVPVEDSSEMQQTFLSKTKKNSSGQNSNTDTYFKRGDRIYVYDQVRRYRFYCRDGFYNNEWFKLLCYSNHPKNVDRPYTEIIDGVGYDLNKTSAENLANEETKHLLEAFNNRYRIEVLQRTPDQLTEQEVRSADLLYFGVEAGIQGIFSRWDTISADRVKAGLEPLVPLGSSVDNKGIIPYNADLSSETLMAIYDECIYQQNVAIMYSQKSFNLSGGTNFGTSVTNNIDKLFHFLAWYKEALTWSYFMPTYTETEDAAYWYNPDYNRIYTDGSLSLCQTEKIVWSNPKMLYNWGYREEDAFPVDKNGTWLLEYFKVPQIPNISQSLYEFNYNNHEFTDQVLEGESKYILGEYVVDSFMSANKHYNIWSILKNRKKDTSILTIEITNADHTSEMPVTKVIYGDEFTPESFEVKFKPIILGATSKTPDLRDITIVYEGGQSYAPIVGPDFDTEYSTNVRSGFSINNSENADSLLNPSVTKKKITVTVTDLKGRSAQDEAWILMREAFKLN